MCIETISVTAIDDTREAYEIGEYLKGHPAIESVDVSLLESTLTIEYDETKVDRESVLDELEYAGCTPAERYSGGFFNGIREYVGV